MKILVECDSNSTAIKDDDENKLQGVADYLTQHESAKFSIVGNTYNIGTAKSKLALGLRRCTLLHRKDEIGQELTGNQSAIIEFDDKISGCLIEEFIM